MRLRNDLNWTGNKFLDFFITLMLGLLCLLFVLGLLKMIFMLILPQPTPDPTDMSFMLIPYLGLPFAFWFFLSLGLMFGLTFNGFKLVTVSSSSDSHNVTTEDKKKRK